MLRKIWMFLGAVCTRHFTALELFLLLLIIGVSFIIGLVEISVLGSIPEVAGALLVGSPAVSSVESSFGDFGDHGSLTYQVVTLFLFMIVSSWGRFIVLLLTNWLQYVVEVKIGCDLIKNTSNLNIHEFNALSVSSIQKQVFSESSALASGIFGALTSTVSQCLHIGMILLFISIELPDSGFYAISGLFAVYIIAFVFAKPLLLLFGEKRFRFNSDRYFAISEFLSSFREVKTYSLANIYLANFLKSSLGFFRAQLAILGIRASVKPFIETFGIFLVCLGFFLVDGLILGTFLPVLAQIAYALFRILPSAQAVYSNIIQIGQYLPVIDEYFDLGNPFKSTSTEVRRTSINSHDECSECARSDGVYLTGLEYAFPGTTVNIWGRGINLELRAGGITVLLGKSGIGKSTLCDLVAGLVEPLAGSIVFVNNGVRQHDISENVAYVSQSVGILGDTLRSNLIVGVRSDRVLSDPELFRILKAVCLDQFVEELESGLNTLVGQGYRELSGGQRSRVGLARALISDRPVLVLDETFSALDEKTSVEILKFLRLSGKTVLIVSHRGDIFHPTDRLIDFEATF